MCVCMYKSTKYIKNTFYTIKNYILRQYHARSYLPSGDRHHVPVVLGPTRIITETEEVTCHIVIGMIYDKEHVQFVRCSAFG